MEISQTEYDETIAKYFFDGWGAGIREVASAISHNRLDEFLYEQRAVINKEEK